MKRKRWILCALFVIGCSPAAQTRPSDGVVAKGEERAAGAPDGGAKTAERVEPSGVGEACDERHPCRRGDCLTLAGGYCSTSACRVDDPLSCPTDSRCVELVIKERAAQTCLLRCESSAVCRGQEGYRCADDGICWNPAPPYWRPAVAAGDCARWWGQAGERLSRCDAAKDNYVVINKGARNVSLCRRGSLVAAFRGGLGAVPVGDKKFQGDKKTPEGVFYVAQKNPDSSYYRALVLSYPDPDDAADGLAAGLIEPREKVAIEQAHAACEEPPQDTGLGGLIELHGFGGLSDWTAGCIAIENQEMDRVWEALAVNDTIVVVP